MVLRALVSIGSPLVVLNICSSLICNNKKNITNENNSKIKDIFKK